MKYMRHTGAKFKLFLYSFQGCKVKREEQKAVQKTLEMHNKCEKCLVMYFKRIYRIVKRYEVQAAR